MKTKIYTFIYFITFSIGGFANAEKRIDEDPNLFVEVGMQIYECKATLNVLSFSEDQDFAKWMSDISGWSSYFAMMYLAKTDKRNLFEDVLTKIAVYEKAIAHKHKMQGAVVMYDDFVRCFTMVQLHTMQYKKDESAFYNMIANLDSKQYKKANIYIRSNLIPLKDEVNDFKKNNRKLSLRYYRAMSDWAQ